MATAPAIRTNADIFTAADYNFLVAALSILGIVTSTQAYARPTEVRIGGSTAYFKKDADGSLIFYDTTNPAGKKLKDLIGQATAEWYIFPRGLLGGVPGTMVGSTVYLWPFKPVKDCLAVAIRDLIHQTTTPPAGANAGIYSDGGVLLSATEAFVPDLDAATHSLSPVVTLSKDTYYWLAIGLTGNMLGNKVSYRPSLVKTVGSTLGTLASTITIPSVWADSGTYGPQFPFIGLVVQDGFTF